ncbi:fimbrial protein [Serratia aquatilis]|uniref:Fimbrial protein n=1 Tax=Serratia aquatilis TaxID=1737515 RepID=A0ABV6EIJ8_9GAMM
MSWKTPALATIPLLCLLNGTVCWAGDINLSGSIIDVPCSIDVDSRNQTLDMGLLPATQIIREGQGGEHAFTIKLVNCLLFRVNEQLPEWRYFQITFDGLNDNGKFGIIGNAAGVALQISDNQGRIAVPGVPLPTGQLSSGEMSLHYSARLVSNSRQLHTGEYSSLVSFKMDYY